MRNSQGTVFISTRTYSEVFKSALATFKRLQENLLLFLHNLYNKFLLLNVTQTLIGISCSSAVSKLHICSIISWPKDRYYFHSLEMSKRKYMWDVRNLRSRKSKLASRHEYGKNMSPQKYYKLKSILMTLQATFWSIRQVLIEVWCNFKYYYFFRYLKTNFVLQFFHI